ncbi:zinc-ribbon domain-containing protein [Streptomyces sp. NPDC001667]
MREDAGMSVKDGCPNCGAPRDDPWRVCPKCGAWFPRSRQAQAGTRTPGQPQVLAVRVALAGHGPIWTVGRLGYLLRR